MSRILSYIFRIIHFILILFLLITPWITSQPTWLAYHFQLVTFLLFKWWYTGGKCHLTTLEHKIRGVEEEDGFIYQFLAPILDIREQNFNWCCYTLVIILGLISYTKWSSIISNQ